MILSAILLLAEIVTGDYGDYVRVVEKAAPAQNAPKALAGMSQPVLNEDTERIKLRGADAPFIISARHSDGIIAFWRKNGTMTLY